MHQTISLADAFGSAELLLRIEELDLARAALDAIAEVAPDAARLHLFRGWLALALSHDQAGDEAKRVDGGNGRGNLPPPISFAPLSPEPLPAGAALASKHFRLALGRDPIEPLAWHGLATSLPEGKEQSAATGRAARLTSSEAVADLRRGKPYLARPALELLHTNRPDDQEWTLLLAECLRRLAEVDAARNLLAPLLDRVPISAPAALLAAALAYDEATAGEYLREAAYGDPAWITARRLWSPEKPPLRLPPTTDVLLPATVVARIDRVGERPVLLDNGDWRTQPVTPVMPAASPHLLVPKPSAKPVAHTGITDGRAAPLGAKGQERGTPAGPRQGQGTETPQEVVDVLREVQRATQRLFGQPPVPLASGEAVALLVTHRGSLARRYGAETAGEILRRIEHLRDALDQRGIRGEILLVDQPPSGAPVLDPSGADGAKAIAEIIRNVRKTIEDGNHRLDAILLIGGDSVIPFHRLANPSQDSDSTLCSDNPYGCSGGSDHVPDIVVARLPDGGADKGDLLLALLQRSVEYHEGWLISQTATPGLGLPFLRRFVASTRVKVPVGAWGASTGSWQEPSQLIFRELESTHPLLICPPAGADTLATGSVPDLGSGKMLYFNLHGLPGGPNWYGQAANAGADEPLPIALTPEHIGELEPASICVSEACYGAEIVSRSPRDSMALRLLSQGALAFVGSTATAYGSVGLPLGGADILAQQVFVNLRRGQPIGRALLLARDWMARQTVERQGYLDPDDAKTLLSFVLLGDPWATPYAKPVMQSKVALPTIEPVVAWRRPIQLSTLPPAAAELAQRLVAKLAPQFARAQITALGQGRPDRMAKGHAGALVFSAAANVGTEDGRRSEQIARITVSQGAAQKVLLSR